MAQSTGQDVIGEVHEDRYNEPAIHKAQRLQTYPECHTEESSAPALPEVCATESQSTEESGRPQAKRPTE